ncbi:MAG: hypothetical protein AAB116_21195, partial [Candidatus Poribacteria bacterium]
WISENLNMDRKTSASVLVVLKKMILGILLPNSLQDIFPNLIEFRALADTINNGILISARLIHKSGQASYLVVTKISGFNIENALSHPPSHGQGPAYIRWPRLLTISSHSRFIGFAADGLNAVNIRSNDKSAHEVITVHSDSNSPALAAWNQTLFLEEVFCTFSNECNVSLNDRHEPVPGINL